jgi:hypothetical protein
MLGIGSWAVSAWEAMKKTGGLELEKKIGRQRLKKTNI